MRQIIDQPWWKICDNECQMNEGELSKFYDDPCADRVIHSVMDNIGDD